MVNDQVDIINCKSLFKSYGRTSALKSINLSIETGKMFGLIGPDGAGKSSLLKIMAGVLSYDQGSISVFGNQLDSDTNLEFAKEKLGFMPQGLGLNLYGDLSIEENIDFFARLKLVSDEELKSRKEKLLKITRLEKFKDRPMKHLSGGMKQKLGLVCSLIHGPKLIILDEPTTGVDPVSRRDFWSILHELVLSENLSAVISTAYMDEADRFDKIALMNAGEVIAQGNPDSIKQIVPGKIYSISSNLTDNVKNEILKINNQIELRGNEYKIFCPNNLGEEFQTILAKLTIDFQVEEPELEDSFIAILKNKYNENVGLKFNGKLYEEVNTDTEVAIKAINISKIYDDFKAVDNVSFEVMPGEVLGLLGANGAGKTTVIKMLTGIIKPTIGQGYIDRVDINLNSNDVKMHIGYMSQAFSLYHDLTVKENLDLYCSVYGISGKYKKERIQSLIELIELENVVNLLVSSLPMGIRQRLALACSLVHQPKVIFLDEPTSGVDPIGRRQLWEIIHKLSYEFKVTILVTTHYMSEAEHCDRIVLMYAGKVVEDSTPKNLKDQLIKKIGTPIEIETTNVFTLKKLLDDNSIPVSLFGNRLRAFSTEYENTINQIKKVAQTNGYSVDNIGPRKLTMEDVFVHRVLELEGQK